MITIEFQKTGCNQQNYNNTDVIVVVVLLFAVVEIFLFSEPRSFLPSTAASSSVVEERTLAERV